MTAVQLVALGTKELGIAPQGFSATPSCQVLRTQSIMLSQLIAVIHWITLITSCSYKCVLAIVAWLALGSTC